jgi:hypothetical protein
MKFVSSQRFLLWRRREKGRIKKNTLSSPALVSPDSRQCFLRAPSFRNHVVVWKEVVRKATLLTSDCLKEKLKTSAVNF